MVNDRNLYDKYADGGRAMLSRVRRLLGNVHEQQLAASEKWHTKKLGERGRTPVATTSAAAPE
jgi:hypothetical protein